MALPEQRTVTVILRTIWSAVQKAASFVITLIIICAIAVTALFLAKIKPYVVTTGSMVPAIPVHSVCFVNENATLESIAVGDVISFRMGDSALVTHRVTAINDGRYTTKGDANNTEDTSPVTAENYIGKTVFVIPKIGTAAVFLHRRTGRVLAAVVIVLLMVTSFIPTKKDEKTGKEIKSGTFKAEKNSTDREP